MNKAAKRLLDGIMISRKQRVYTVDVSLKYSNKAIPKRRKCELSKKEKKKETHICSKFQHPHGEVTIPHTIIRETLAARSWILYGFVKSLMGKSIWNAYLAQDLTSMAMSESMPYWTADLVG